MRIAKIAICLTMLGFLSSCVVYPYDPVVYEPAPLTAPSAHVYQPVPPPPPPRVYVAPAPVYVAPAPVYVAPPPVVFGGVYIRGGHGGHGGHHGGHH